jgi:hypothetical protein
MPAVPKTAKPTARASVGRTAADGPDRAALPPTPSSDVPLADAFDALAARARGGDGPAAVRLLSATLQCARFRNEKANADSLETNPSPKGNVEGRARLAAKAREFVAANEALCAGATREQTDTAGERLPRAAASGDPGSQACYAEMGAGTPGRPNTRRTWVDAMRRYRENARSDAQAAFAAGVPQSAYTLYELSAGRYAMMSYVADSAIAPDYPKAYARALFFQSARFDIAGTRDDGESLSAIWRVRAKLLERELSAADIERANRWADAEAQRSAARTPPTLPCEGFIGP